LESQRELPYQQLISVGGLRLLLTHAHYPDRQDELVSRRDDSWHPKLDRRAEMGRRAGAQIVVFGHTHVPMSLIWRDTLLINPGAIAPGTHFARQSLMSVARLLVCADRSVAVEYIDLEYPHLPFVPHFDVDVGFQASLAQVNAPIIATDMQPLVQPIAALFRPGGLPLPDADTVRDVLRRLAYPRWLEDREPISWDELEAALYRDLPTDLWERTMAIIDAHRLVVR
ncbi:MAG: hypothetical protein HGA65_15385, partial [Oscillochloris sp.]|nr:hypothetical protein [Oscillochloris sp.]